MAPSSEPRALSSQRVIGTVYLLQFRMCFAPLSLDFGRTRTESRLRRGAGHKLADVGEASNQRPPMKSRSERHQVKMASELSAGNLALFASLRPRRPSHGPGRTMHATRPARARTRYDGVGR